MCRKYLTSFFAWMDAILDLHYVSLKTLSLGEDILSVTESFLRLLAHR